MNNNVINSAYAASKKPHPKHIKKNMDFKLDEIKKFELSNVSRDIIKIDIDRYEELLPYIYYFKGKYEHINKTQVVNVLFVNRYELTCKALKYAELKGILYTPIGSINVNQAELNLITVLAVDSEFNYLNDHIMCLEKEMNEEEFFIKKYGFYSRKLILMELHVCGLIKKYENNMLHQDSNIRK